MTVGVARAYGAAALAAGLGLAALGVAAAGTPADGTPAAGAASPIELSFAAFNRRFSEPGAALGTVRQGTLTLSLASPENAVEVLTHRLRLAPLGDGSHRAELTVAVRGRGRLVADLSVADGAPGRLVDEVVLPAQTVAIEGRVELTPVADGYRVVPRELPETVGLEVESALAGKLVTLCTGFALLAPGAVDCGGLERSLTRVALPLPKPGEELLLPFAALADDERRLLDDYLARAPRAAEAAGAAQAARAAGTRTPPARASAP